MDTASGAAGGSYQPKRVQYRVLRFSPAREAKERKKSSSTVKGSRPVAVARRGQVQGDEGRSVCWGELYQGFGVVDPWWIRGRNWI